MRMHASVGGGGVTAFCKWILPPSNADFQFIGKQGPALLHMNNPSVPFVIDLSA